MSADRVKPTDEDAPKAPGYKGVYGIDFDTKTYLPSTGHIRYLKVTLEYDVMGPQDSVRVDLSAHPMYHMLERFVLANPSKKK